MDTCSEFAFKAMLLTSFGISPASKLAILEILKPWLYNKVMFRSFLKLSRLYLLMLVSVLSGSSKIMIDQNSGNGVVPYLPLNELNKTKQTRDNN